MSSHSADNFLRLIAHDAMPAIFHEYPPCLLCVLVAILSIYISGLGVLKLTLDNQA